MADLENLLLEAAGRTGGSSRSRQSAPPTRRRHENPFSDDGSDYKDDDSDDNHIFGGKKSSSSQVPLKKRGKDGDDDQGSQDDDRGEDASDREGVSGDDSDVGSDLYKDEDDRQQLAQLTELEREMILSDRAMKLDDKKLHERVKSRWKSDTKPQPSKRESAPPPASSRGVRTSARSADRAAHKADALNELRAKRMRQQGLDASRFGSGSGSRGYSPVKRKAFTSAGLSSSSQSDSESESRSEDGRPKRGGKMDNSDDEMSKHRSNIPTYEDIRGITIRRSKLSKWFMDPFFEELIVGCFVRVGIGMKSGQSIYRLCIVRNVDASDPNKQYKLDNKMTYKFLNCVWGSETSAARWQMARVSDSPPLEEEYNLWKKEVERTNGRMPTKKEVAEKRSEIERVNTFVYSAETVKQILQDKKSATTRPLNIAAEKEKLRREMEAAQYRNDEASVERIKARLQELDKVRNARDMKDSKAQRLTEMNRKNRVENFKAASELKPVNLNLKQGEAGYDPFSRRWTRSQNYYNAGGSDNKPNGDTEGDAGNNGGANGVVATAAALEAAAGAGKLTDTSAPVDQGTEFHLLHDFDLPISLTSLQRYGGAQGVLTGFMARKQRIEATIGYRVPENDGRRHALTLSVSDYKRRRGLL
ncbi:hypothetical protein RND81_06G114300 [Saponaria officinalis]|uniref:Plus3 domain-containing protein n=1 Tax=Saponaria officinalis TaxID=3572 RepID=A0AAW1KAI9_SAPOF